MHMTGYRSQRKRDLNYELLNTISFVVFQEEPNADNTGTPQRPESERRGERVGFRGQLMMQLCDYCSVM